MSKFCKKCGAELLETNVIAKVKAGSLAEKNNIEPRDSIVAVDGQLVKTKADIDAAVKEKNACKLNIKHDEKTRTINVENPVEFLKGIEFEPEKTCHKCGANQNASKAPFIVLLIAIAVVAIVGVIVAVALNKKASPQIQDVEIEDPNINFSRDTIGSDNLTKLKEDEVNYSFKGNSISITNAGALTPAERNKNLSSLNEILEKKENTVSSFPDFDDSEPIFSKETVGSDSFRKMYNKNLSFDIRKPTISNYDFDNLPKERLANIGQTKKEIVGTVYFDYGYANVPKNAVVQTKKITLGKIDFDKNQYVETIVALRNLLSEIPQVVLSKTIFYVDGHTDHVSSYDFNQNLSEARAECIKEILVKDFGLNENNIVTKGYSWSNLAVDTDEECAENRRVEISVAFFD